MPTIEENITTWSNKTTWLDNDFGETWSANWGGSDVEWWWTIFPRIHKFLPTDTVLEIACGYGRWSAFLKELCKDLVLVDMSDNCIQACKMRFPNDPHISFFLNDGRSLDMLRDRSVDFAFSFDSLVHAEEDVIRAYLIQLGSKLKSNGVAFIHHSNYGACRKAWIQQFPKKYHHSSPDPTQNSLGQRVMPKPHKVSEQLYVGTVKLLERFGYELDALRATSMTTEKFATYAENAGMSCISQEIVNWTRKKMTDCISIVTPKGSLWQRPNRIVVNNRWIADSKNAGRLAQIYGDLGSKSPPI